MAYTPSYGSSSRLNRRSPRSIVRSCCSSRNAATTNRYQPTYWCRWGGAVGEGPAYRLPFHREHVLSSCSQRDDIFAVEKFEGGRLMSIHVTWEFIYHGYEDQRFERCRKDLIVSGKTNGGVDGRRCCLSLCRGHVRADSFEGLVTGTTGFLSV